MVIDRDDDCHSMGKQSTDWWTSALGDDLLRAEKKAVERWLATLFGYHLIQLGPFSSHDLLGQSTIAHKTICLSVGGKTDLYDSITHCTYQQLPIRENSVDVAILPHTLEYSADPHSVLREIERVLIGEGHLLILGFNPWSLWGLTRVSRAWWDDSMPWCGHFIGTVRIRDWLALLGFEVVKMHYILFRPPIRAAWLYQKLVFLEELGYYGWPIFGGVYVLLAKKRIIPLTPVKKNYARRHIIKSGVAEPTL